VVAGQLAAGVDLFRIKVSDILATPSAQEVVSRFRAGDPAYAGLVVLNGNDIDLVKTVLANTGNATVQGPICSSPAARTSAMAGWMWR
jgi:iron complex outermembrane receptor protein